jgi:quinol monooxygenase YgiN
MTKLTPSRLAHINVFTPKPGLMDEFMAVQLRGLPTLADLAGSRGSWLFRACDDRDAVLVALFDNEASHRRFMRTPEFQQHRERLLPLLQSTGPAYYTLAYVAGAAADALAAAES